MTKNEILNKLISLDFSKYPYDEVNELIKTLGKYIVLSTKIDAGTVIARARVNCNFEIFSKKTELSYKPKEFNNSYQRASTPYTTMFYGAVLPPEVLKGDVGYLPVIGACEVSKLLRDDKIPDGEQTVTLAKWRVIKDFNLISIVHHDKLAEQNSFVKKLNVEYKELLSTFPEYREDSLSICNFFASQFAKSETPKDYDYLLSAIYAERITTVEGLAGVLYPSVRAEGKGINVAISPTYADHNLQLEGVVQCALYKKNNSIVCDNDKEAYLSPGQDSFILNDIVNPKQHVGRDVAYKIISGEIKTNQN